MSEETEVQYVISPAQVAAMVDAAFEERVIAGILEAAAKVNFQLDDDIECDVFRHEDENSADWEYTIKFALTYIKDLEKAEKIGDFIEQVERSQGRFTIRFVEISSPVVIRDFRDPQSQ